jgi:hypothetical protein
MTRIILDAEMRAKLQNLTEEMELYDEAGRVLGRFFPALQQADQGRREPQVSEEELDRREQSTEWYTTAEVLAYLEKL